MDSSWERFEELVRAEMRKTYSEAVVEHSMNPRNLGNLGNADSEALGHASVGFTMDIYSHIIEGMQQDAMALLDEVLPAGENVVSQKINANLTPELSQS